MQRTKDNRFKHDYSKKDILEYLKGVYKILNKPPTFRDLHDFPGPSPRTIVRRFGYWSEALKKAGIRPQTHQLQKGERTFIRLNWRKMTDKDISQHLGVSEEVIKYYRMNYNLWKNRKGTARSTYRREALKIYGKNCEVCNISLCEWHHIIPKSTNQKDWCILCPTCHAVITRKLVVVENRQDLELKLKPYIMNLHKEIKFES